MSSHFVGWHRSRARNMSGGIFGRWAHVDDDDVAASQSRCELLSSDRFDVAAIAEVRGGELLDAGNVFSGDIAQRGPEFA